jgi:hypothetical protein
VAFIYENAAECPALLAGSFTGYLAEGISLHKIALQ